MGDTTTEINQLSTRLLPVSKESLNQKIDSRPVGNAIKNDSSDLIILNPSKKSTYLIKFFKTKATKTPHTLSLDCNRLISSRRKMILRDLLILV